MSFWINKRVFVTGACGLVGSHLVKRLVENGADVVVLIRDENSQSEFFLQAFSQKVSIIRGRLEDHDSVRRALIKYEIDTIFHLGAQTIIQSALLDPLSTFESNIRGTYLLLEACRLCCKNIERIVIASSDKAYGSISILPYTENTPLRGLYPYDVSKSCADLLATAYYHTYQLPIVIARCGNIFGGGDLNWSRIIPGTIKSFYYGKSPIIRSDGTPTRDYIFVEDAVDAYLLMAEKIQEKSIQGEAFNFGPNNPCSVLKVAEKIQIMMNRSNIPLKILNQAKSEIFHQFLNSEKAKKYLSWQPKFSLDQGLKMTIEWYENFFSKKEVCQSPDTFLSQFTHK